MSRRLLIVDHYDSEAFDRAAALGDSRDGWDVFLLGGSPDWFRWRYPHRAAQLPGARILHSLSLAPDAHALVNEFVLRAGATLPAMPLAGETLAGLLAAPSGTEWWFLEVSEKAPYRGPLFGRLYRLALLRLIARERAYAEVWVCLRERALDDLFPAFAGDVWRRIPAIHEAPTKLEHRPYIRLGLQMTRAFGRFASARVLCSCVAAPVVAAAPTGRWIFTVFPSWWTRPSTQTPGDRFLTNVKEARFDGYFAWLTESRLLWRHVEAVRAAFREMRIVPLQQFVTWREAVSVFSPRAFSRLWRFRRRMQPHLRLPFAGVEAAPLIADEIVRSLSGYECLQDRLLARAMSRAAERFRPRLVLYRAEFQPIESALLRGLRGKAAAVGFHHHPFGPNQLTMRFTEGEMADHLREPVSPDARPFPDGIVSIGSLLARHIVDGNYPASRVTVCGPQRYGSLVTYRRRQAPPRVLRLQLQLAADGLLIFVALAIVEADTEALFGALVSACRDVSGLRIVVRTHPNRPAGDPALRATLDALGATASLMPASGTMYDYIAASDCMVCMGSMIAFEAMALGIMPIVFDNPSTFGAVSLAEYDDGMFVVRDAVELHAAIEDVRSDSPRAQTRRKAWPRLLAAVMGDLDRPLGPQMDRALDMFDPAVAAQKIEGRASRP